MEGGLEMAADEKERCKYRPQNGTNRVSLRSFPAFEESLSVFIEFIKYLTSMASTESLQPFWPH